MLTITRYATCTTTDCRNWGKPIPVTSDEGNLIFCGPCGNQVTDITDIKPGEGTMLPEWISEMLQMQSSTN